MTRPQGARPRASRTASDRKDNQMFVVMSVTATDAEIITVKNHILAEGLTPYEHRGAERLVVAGVGGIGGGKSSVEGRLWGLPGVEVVKPISRPLMGPS